jgi:N-acetylmuramoyl-L-alanine amidase
MGPVARRKRAGLILAWLASAALVAAQIPSRAAPTRPSSDKPASTSSTNNVTAAKPKPAPKTKASPKTDRPAPKISYVDLTEIATKLSLKVAVEGGGRKAIFTQGGTRKLELEADSREARINGVRVFLGQPAVMRDGKLHVSSIDYHTCLVPLLKPTLISRPPPVPKTIVIDPGHGGVDQGTQNARLKLKEKVFTLDVSLRLKKLLETRGYKVVLTRDSDERVDLVSRPIIANRAGADLFVSIHFNALLNDQKTRGTEVFTFAPQHQRSTNAWGGQADDTEHEPAAANRFDAANSLLAHMLHRELLERLQTFDRGKKIGHLGMLRGLNCPAALVESGFLSNDEEAKKIATPAYRQEIAEALASGIEHYASTVRVMRSK